jgi:hypothetical protein
MPGLGNKAILRVGVEATYATPVTVAASLEVIRANIDPNIGTIPDPSLYSGVSRRAFFQGGLFHQGKVLIRPNYGATNGTFGRLLKAAFGAVTEAGASAPFTHTYKEATTPPSLTLELSEGDVPTGKVKQASGAIITDMTMRGTAGQGEGAMIEAEFGVFAKTIATNFSPSATPGLSDLSPLLFHQSTTVTDDGSGDTQANQRMRSFEVTLQNNYDLGRWYFGSINPDQPVRNDFLSVRWRIVSEFANINAIGRATAFTTTSPTVKVSAGANANFEIHSKSAKLTEYSNPVEGYGVVLMNMTHEAFLDPTDQSALVAILINANSATTEDGNP